MPCDVSKNVESAGRAFKVGLGCNLIIIIMTFGFGFASGSPSSPTLNLSEVGKQLHVARSNAAANSKWIFKHNLAVGSRIVAMNVIPIYGILVSSGMLGLSLGFLIKSMTLGSNLPFLVALTMLAPHGVPEYAGFILLQNSVTSLQLSFLGKLLGLNLSLQRALFYAFVRLTSGVLLVGVGAVVEGYVTPFISERLLLL